MHGQQNIKKRLIGCSETSVTEDKYMPCNVTEQQGLIYTATEAWKHAFQVCIVTKTGTNLL